MDLAEGHLAALDRLNLICGMQVINLGTGCGYSVLQMIKAMENVTEKKIPYQYMQRRNGDVSACYAKVTLANATFGWSAKRDLLEMCRISWFYESNREQ
jgi:UDP-glucose 4-epimerase